MALMRGQRRNGAYPARSMRAGQVCLTSCLICLALVAACAPNAINATRIQMSISYEGSNHWQPAMTETGWYYPTLQLAYGDAHVLFIDSAAVLNYGDSAFEELRVALSVLHGKADLELEGPVREISTDARPRYPSVELLSPYDVEGEAPQIVTLHREDLLNAGDGFFRFTVYGRDPTNEYRLYLEEAFTSLRPSPKEQSILQQLHDQCCGVEGACPLLRRAVQTATKRGSSSSAPENFCQLEGQSCDTEGFITSIRLTGQRLKCKFPSSLRSLVRLAFLDLTNNGVQGGAADIFSALSALPLKSLRLRNNELDGELKCFPYGVPIADSLIHLDLSFNNFTGEFPACVVPPAAQIFKAENNYMSGQFPSQLAASETLMHFDISGWQVSEGLTGSLPDFSVWSKLNFLDVSQNSASGHFPALPPTIRAVHIYGNYLFGTLPERDIAELQLLEVLLADNNRFTGPLPARFNSSLQTLRLGQNTFQGPVPSHWSSLSQLRELSLHGNAISGAVPPYFALMPFLWALDLQENSFTGNLYKFASMLEVRVWELELAPSLLDLNISHNALTGALPDAFAGLATFDSAWMARHGIHGEMIRPRRMDVSHNALNGSFPYRILENYIAGPLGKVRVLQGNNISCPQWCLEGNAGLGADPNVLTCIAQDAEVSQTVSLAENQLKLCRRRARAETSLAASLVALGVVLIASWAACLLCIVWPERPSWVKARLTARVKGGKYFNMQPPADIPGGGSAGTEENADTCFIQFETEMAEMEVDLQDNQARA